MNKKWIRVLVTLAVIAALIVVLVLASGGTETFEEKYKEHDLSVLESEEGYNRYLSAYADLPPLGEEKSVDVLSFETAKLVDGKVVPDAAPDGGLAREETDETGTYLHTDSRSFVIWTVDMPQEALVNLEIEYRAPESRGVDLERSLYVDDGSVKTAEDGTEEPVGLAIPFEGAESLAFYRIWHDGDLAAARRFDNQDNQRRPSQEEIHDWQTVLVKDAMGYVVEPYRIHLRQGVNRIALFAVNEPMDIRAITLKPVEPFRTYDEYVADMKAEFEGANAETSASARAWSTTIEGEGLVLSHTAAKNDQPASTEIVSDFSRRSSSPSLYARYDRSSPATEPYDVYHTVFNYIGGDPWDSAGQWIEWSFDVPENGWYKITVKARQNHQRGALSCRTLYIDGQVPFADVSSLAFSYNNAWDMVTLQRATENGKEDALFYFDAGTHTIRLEATLGEMGPILLNMKDSVDRLNAIYRRILVYTGVNPDRFRDYNLEGTYPDIIERMELEYRNLYKLVDDTVKITGQKSDRVAVAQTLAVQMEGFVTHTERITQAFSNFKDNITSLGTAMQNMSETKLDIDQIIISGQDVQVKNPSQGFFDGLGHELRSLVASYTVDYDALGDKYEDTAENKTLEVWITTGRDQSAVLKSLIDQDFAEKFGDAYGMHVNVKLVLADTLLTAVVAGNGPDVVLSVGTWFPVNYAMRNAVEDMNQFDADWVAANFEPEEDGTYRVKNYEQVIKDYYPSALEAFEYNNKIYALPETQEFSVVFYRTDVLAEMGIDPEKDLSTWKGIISLLHTIQGNNMSIGVAYPDITNPDTSVLNSLIYQHGGRIYDGNKMRTRIDSEAGVAAFKLYTSLYNDYGLPTVFDFVSRFRTGEMPIGIANYSMYNTLAVSAPEIRGLWDFTYFPGTYRTEEDVIKAAIAEGADPETVDPNVKVYNTGEVVEDRIDRTVHAQGVCCMIIKTDDPQMKKKAWTFLQWWTDAQTQISFGREMESVLGSSARYTTANKEAIKGLGWSEDQLKILETQMSWTHGFPEIAGGYSTTRHMTNAIRKVINEKADARETLLTYTQTINEEIRIKRREFGLPTNQQELEEWMKARQAETPAGSETPGDQ